MSEVTRILSAIEGDPVQRSNSSPRQNSLSRGGNREGRRDGLRITTIAEADAAFLQCNTVSGILAATSSRKEIMGQAHGKFLA